MPDAVTFSKLQLKNWKQFRNVEISFHPRLTVLTGANACGKTTVLSLLARHFSWTTQVLGVPVDGASNAWKFDDRTHEGATSEVGSLTYSSDVTASYRLPGGARAIYDLQVANQQFVAGVFISSHRNLYSHQPLTEIPATFSSGEAVWQTYVNETANRYAGRFSQTNPAKYMKQQLLAANMYGEQTASRRGIPEAKEVWDGFVETLGVLLPESLGFVRLEAQPPEIVLKTSTGDFLLEAASGGLSSLIELAWMVFLRSRGHDSFTVCLDEPENHLHPSMQRTLLPNLLRAFRDVHFVVATHSPFVITAVPESNVYVLDYSEGQVESRLLDATNRAANADDTLRRVLGLDTTIPLWVERRVRAAIDQFQSAEPTEDNARRLYGELESAGLTREFPAALKSLQEGE